MTGQQKSVDKAGAGELTVVELFRVLSNYRWVIAGVTTTCIVIAALSAFLATPVYKAQTLIAPQSEGSSSGGALSSIMSSLGGIPGFGGMGLARGSFREGMATLRSPQFTREFITDFDLLPVLFAGKWDPDKKDWAVGSPEEKPTLEDGYILFNENIRKIIEEDNGLVTLSIEWTDRHQAALWANELIRRLNARLRKRTIDEANQTIVYLEKEAEKTRIVELQQAIYFMIESQINTRTLANVREDFVAKVISPAIAPDADRYFKPKRRQIIMTGAVIGVVSGIFLSFLLFAIKRIRSELAASEG